MEELEGIPVINLHRWFDKPQTNRNLRKKNAKIKIKKQMEELEGIPVINLHLWFDRKLKA